MNASLIAIYMKPEASVELSLLEALVHEGGFQLRNPQSGNVTSIDEEGEFHVTEKQVLIARINQREDTRLQFWESTWEGKCPRDLYCQLLFKREAIVVEFGELPPDSDLLLKGLWALFCRALGNGQIIGLVVDRRGVTEEYADWDAFFIEGQAYEGPCPDVVCVKDDQEGLLPAACLKGRRDVRSHYITVFNEQAGRVLEE